LSSLSGEDLEIEAGVLAAELDLEAGTKRVGVLIGGDTASLRFDPARFESLILGLRAFAKRSGAQLLVTTSRRTPAWAESVLKTLLDDRSLCPLLLLANESNRAGVVAGILGMSDVLLVTAESMSMASEAVSTGKPVIAARPWLGAGLKAKHEEFLSRLEKDGFLRASEPADLEGDLNGALSGAWPGAGDYRAKEEAVLHEAVKRVVA
jgi:mitochondrial fission protein ELM1